MEQVGEWVPQCFGDPSDVKLAAFCSTEPEAGSDVAAIRTRARYDEATKEWVLNGQKAFATNGGIANIHVVTASVDPSLGARGQAAFVVPPGTPGLVGSAKLKKLGLRASRTADVPDDVHDRCLLGAGGARHPAGPRPLRQQPPASPMPL
jgi:acyl-CoA dehydrogenase